MSATIVSVTETVRNFSDVISRVAYRRESFVLRKGNKAVAELRPVPTGCRLGDLPAILGALPRLSPEEAAAFEVDLESARQTLPPANTEDPWAS